MVVRAGVSKIISQKFVIFSAISSVTLTVGGLDNADLFPVGPLPGYYITRRFLSVTHGRGTHLELAVIILPIISAS